MPEADVTINFDTKFHGEGAAKATTAVKDVSKTAKEGSSGLKTLGKDFGGLGSQAAGLIKVIPLIGTALAGLSIPAFVMRSVDAYVNKVGGSTEIGNRWLVATDKLDIAYYKIGRTLTGLVLPAMEGIAGLAEKGAAALIVLPEAAVGALEDWRRRAGVPTTGRAGAMAQQAAAWGADDERRREEMRAKIGTYTAAGGAAGELPISKILEYRQLWMQEREQRIQFERQTFLLRRSYEKQEEYAIFDYNKTRMRTLRDFNRQLQYTTEDFQRSQFRSLRDFRIQEAITVEAYQRQRYIANRDFQISLSRNEYDYQKQRSRAQYDHNWNIRMAMLQGDAMAVWQSNRQFKIEQQRAEEDYQLSKTRSIEDFQRGQNDARIAFEIERKNAKMQFDISRADALLDFQIQRKRSLEQFAIMRNDQEIDFQIQRERAKYQYNLQLMDMQYQFNEEIRLRRQLFVERHLPELIMEENMMMAVRRRITEAEVAKWEALLAQIRQGGVVPLPPTRYAEGGDVGRTGLALVHRGEFVLTPETTKAAQSLLGSGRMTQESILGMLGGRVSMVNNFSRGMSADEKYIIKNQLMQLLAEGFAK